MNEEKVIKQFKDLTTSAKKEASDFISYLHKKYKIKKTKSNNKKIDPEKIKFYGMWKDREDMKDSTQWVRDVRKKQWSGK